MAYPADPPFPASELDVRDKDKLSALYYWAGSANRLADWLNASGIEISTGTINGWRRRHGLPIANDAYRARGGVFASGETAPKSDPLADDLKTHLKRCKEPQTVEALADHFDVSPKTVRTALEVLESEAVLVHMRGESVCIERDMQPVHEPLVIPALAEVEYPIGAVADSHLGSKYERLDVLDSLYDRFADYGVETVYHGGNWIDGEARFNKFDIYSYGLDDQLDNFIAKYPSRPGIKTHIISGDDHEGWYVQREHVNIGAYMEMRAKAAGREDLIDLGYMERDILYSQPGGSATIRVIHAGGGSAYATSYTMQKYVESLQGGEKPQIVIAGHYHKYEFGYPREVYTIQPGCTQDQTPFMRKRKLQSHVGGCVVWVKQNELGVFSSVKVEWMPYFDKKYYQFHWDKPEAVSA